jgi:hypothetical protein
MLSVHALRVRKPRVVTLAALAPRPAALPRLAARHTSQPRSRSTRARLRDRASSSVAAACRAKPHEGKRAGLSAGSFVGAMAQAPFTPRPFVSRGLIGTPHPARPGRSRDWAHVWTANARASSPSDKAHGKFLVGAAEMPHLIRYRPSRLAYGPSTRRRTRPGRRLLHINVSGFGTISDGTVMAPRHRHGNRIALRIRIETGVHQPAADERNDAVRQHRVHLAPRELALDDCRAHDRRQRHAADRREPDGAAVAERTTRSMPPLRGGRRPTKQSRSANACTSEARLLRSARNDAAN